MVAPEQTKTSSNASGQKTDMDKRVRITSEHRRVQEPTRDIDHIATQNATSPHRHPARLLWSTAMAEAI